MWPIAEYFNDFDSGQLDVLLSGLALVLATVEPGSLEQRIAQELFDACPSPYVNSEPGHKEEHYGPTPAWQTTSGL